MTIAAAFIAGVFVGYVAQCYRHRYLMDIIHGYYHADRVKWGRDLAACRGSSDVPVRQGRTTPTENQCIFGVKYGMGVKGLENLRNDNSR